MSLLLGDQLRHFRVRAYVLYAQNLVGIQMHIAGFVEFFSPPDQDIVSLFGLGIGLTNDVVNLFQHGRDVP